MRWVEVGGHVEAGFEAVRDAFALNFTERDDVGASCCVYRHGRAVVDLWGGVADPASDRPWAEDTTAIVFSSTKGVTATCVNRLIEQGALEADAPVARWWPEFAAAGKEAITLRQVLCHQAGLAVVTADLTLEEVLAWQPVVDAIAAQAPIWEPGSAHGYHVRAFGWILGEVVRRVTGMSLGTWFAKEIAGPLGLDFWIGLPEAERARCARLVPPPADSPKLEDVLGADSLTVRALSGPSDLFAYDDMWNRPEILAAEMPSSNGVGNARALARLYAATLGEVDGVRLLSDDTRQRATAVQSKGPDEIILVPTRFGLGYSLPPMLGTECGRGAFGHPGAGGSLGFADPDAGLGFGYVMNRMHPGLMGDERATSLVRAVCGCLR